MAAKRTGGSSNKRTARKKSAATGHAVGNAVKAKPAKPAKPMTRPAKVAERGRAVTPEPTQVEVTAAKGRPMLTWVGKRALERVTAFPAQLVEKFSVPGGAEPASWTDWPAGYPKGGLLFHGDNNEVLAHLLANGFRGKVKLIYIDPPFDSGADYVRKVALRGAKGTAKLDGASYSLGEQVQYTDIWANDNYLQFMYERLQLLRELMDVRAATVVVHCDWRRAHQLRVIGDEVFGESTFANEIFWYYYNKMHDSRKGLLPRATNTLLVWRWGDRAPFHDVDVPRESTVKQLRRVKVDGVMINLKDEDGNLVYQDSDSKTLDNVWPIPLIPPADIRQKTEYPTQKPEALLEVLLRLYSDPNDLILDCFIGSGTTAAVAQKLGRRWIGCDINKGAIQTTAKRLQGVIAEQTEAATAVRKTNVQRSLLEEPSATDAPPPPAQSTFSVWRVNDYDLQIQHNEAVQLACEHLGVTRTRSDAFFDGTLGNALVKIIPFGHPLTPVDLDEIRRELESRRDEERAVKVVSLGADAQAFKWLEDWNRTRRGAGAINRFELIELRTDTRYGRVIRHEPAKARVEITRKGASVHVTIKDFVSPSILERLATQAGIVAPDVDDWRAMVDCVMIDPAWDGSIFNVALSDIPDRKTDLVGGTYELPGPQGKTIVAVKIIDMLGEEVVVTNEV